ncbi:hypothetical protein CR513_51205, partial [Mucuna pruriens]
MFTPVLEVPSYGVDISDFDFLLSPYWPTLKKDSMEFVKKCNKCQQFINLHKAPSEPLHLVMSPCPFYTWGVDILGPFPLVVGQVKFLIVTVNYTKWVEVELVVTILAKRIKRFYWRKIICRFGLSGVIVSDNGTQFASWLVANFCSQLGIKQAFTSSSEAGEEGWRKQRDNGQSNFVKYFGHTILPPTPPPRKKSASHPQGPFSSNQPRTRRSYEQTLTYFKKPEGLHTVTQRYKTKVFLRKLKKQDLVLRRVLKDIASNKLTLNWKGPCRIIEKVRRGAFWLEHLDKKKVPHLEYGKFAYLL